MLQLLAAPLAASLLFSPVTGYEDSRVAVAIEASAPAFPESHRYSLGALVDKPDLRLGETVNATVQFHGELEEWNPFLTRFDPSAYRGLTLWADEQWLWLKDDFDAPRAIVFARRGTHAEAVLSGAKRHDRLELDLVVRELHAGRAWIEVTGARWTEQQTPEGTVLHAIRALDMIEREGWALAVSELERALKPNLPSHVRLELAEILRRCEAARDVNETR